MSNDNGWYNPAMPPQAEPLSMDEIMESLYNFNQDQLRRLAHEALLISDGPDTHFEHKDPDFQTVALFLMLKMSS